MTADRRFPADQGPAQIASPWRDSGRDRPPEAPAQARANCDSWVSTSTASHSTMTATSCSRRATPSTVYKLDCHTGAVI
jgi:hypothetical protein